MSNDNTLKHLSLEKKAELIYYDITNTFDSFYSDMMDEFPNMQLISKDHTKPFYMIAGVYVFLEMFKRGDSFTENYETGGKFIKGMIGIGISKIPNFLNRLSECETTVTSWVKDSGEFLQSDDYFLKFNYSLGSWMFCNVFSRFPSSDSENDAKQLLLFGVKILEKVFNYWKEKSELYLPF